MKLLLVEILAISLSLVFISCDEDNVTDSDVNEDNDSINDVNLVRVKVDLQYGFTGNFVRVKFNGDSYFSAFLDEMAPLSGPLATFTTYLPQGLNQCEIFWREILVKANYTESKEFNLGNADIYYMGIRVSNDSTLVIDLQEEPFGYM